MSETQTPPDSEKKEKKDEKKDIPETDSGKEENKRSVQITFKYSDHPDHVYLVTAGDVKGETRIQLNGEEIKLLEVGEMSAVQKRVYIDITHPGGSKADPTPQMERYGRLGATLIYFHEQGLHRDFNNLASRMCLFNNLFYRLFHAKPLAEKYVVDETCIRIEGEEETIPLPGEGCDPSGTHYAGAFQYLNSKVKPKD